MKSSSRSQPKSIFMAVRDIWEKNKSLDNIEYHKRNYLTQSVNGFLKVVFRTYSDMQINQGLMHMPDALIQDANWWPADKSQSFSRLLLFDVTQPKNWKITEPVCEKRSQTNREVWFACAGREGCIFLVARKSRRSSKIPIFAEESWEVMVSYNPDLFQLALDALMQVFVNKKVPLKVVEELKSICEYLTSENRRFGNEVPLQTGLNLVDDLNQYNRKRYLENKWMSVVHRIQDAVAWELRSDRLMQSIGTILRGTLNYDYIDIHIFQRAGKRYEAFISWRRNYTGFGDNQMSLLLCEQLVSDVLRAKRPRMIKLDHPDGLMNPRLAQLAELDEGLIVPLVHGKATVGLVTLCYKRPISLTSAEMDKISQIGKIVAKSVAASNAHTQVHRMATIDGLTNIYNRRFFNEQIQKELKRAKRYHHSVTLIMIDIDHFKHYNDTNGHLMGDRVLKKFAQVVRGSVRDEDLVARYGGEEFVVVLPFSEVKKGIVVAEKIRREVLLTSFPHGDKQPLGKFTISLGIADNREDVTDHQKLINHADLALYKAKSNGRNQTVIYSKDLDSDH